MSKASPLFLRSTPVKWCALFALLFFGAHMACHSEAKPPASSPGQAVDDSTHPANRLADETSPYLLMHAHNPVDWYPWGPEAFAKAKRENKLIFLSIGYSSCYWCHVMERESFMDEQIASLLNKDFVCIKVDREERPDVDDIYMTAIQLLTRRGGWPLSVFLTPDARPVIGGTYFPARQGDRGGRMGFLELITAIQRAWKEHPDEIKQQAARLTDAVAQVLIEQQSNSGTIPEPGWVNHVQEAMEKDFDPDFGGFGQPPFPAHNPKFPSPPELLYLIDRIERQPDPKAEEMLLLTLDKMAQGGIRDHLGGGFHRYSVDRYWRIPHFEKMLYDNAQLASVYAEAFALTGNETYRQVVEELLEFVLREMTDEGGGFYAAIDAETDAEEGKYYRWEKDELQSLLDEKEYVFAGPIYGFSDQPNFHHEGHDFCVLCLPAAPEQLAAERKLSLQQFEKQLAPVREQLFEARQQRKRPLTDTKILTAWNGLMIRGFADAGRVLKNERYLQVAERAATFVLDNLQTEDGRLHRSYRNGSSQLNAYLVDYAFLVDGLIALYRATHDPRWLEAASKLTDKQIELFWDERAGGFFFTSSDHETLIARAKKQTDNVLPSGNGVAQANLVYLASALPEGHYGDYADRMAQALSVGLQDPAVARRMPTTATATAAWLELREPEDRKKLAPAAP